MVSKLRHLLYGTLYNLGQRSKRQLCAQLWLETAAFVYVSIRVIILTILIVLTQDMSQDQPQPQQKQQPEPAVEQLKHLWTRWDYFPRVARDMPRAFPAQIGLMAVFVWVTRVGLLHHCGCPRCRWSPFTKFYIFVVCTRNLFDHCRRGQPAKSGKLWQHRSVVTNARLFRVGPSTFHREIQAFRAMAHFSLRKVWQRRRSFIPDYFHLPGPLLVRLYQLIILVEAVCCAVQLFVVFLLVCFGLIGVSYFLSIRSNLSEHSAWKLSLATLDYTLLFYEFFSLVQAGFTYTFFSGLGTVVFRHKVRYALCRLNQTPQVMSDPLPGLRYFLREYLRMRLDIIRGNQAVWGAVLATFLLTNLPPNVYLCTRIILDSGSLTGYERAVTWTVLVCQTASGVLVLVPLASFAGVIHSARKPLVAVQATLKSTDRRSVLWYKLKIDQLTQCLSRGPKYGVTIGPMHAITYRSIAELFLMYGGFLMFAFKAKMTLQLL